MSEESVHLYELISPENPDEILQEVVEIIHRINPDHDATCVVQAFQDTVQLFQGDYPGYQACNTVYHDLEHACATFLAMARILHGLQLNNIDFSMKGMDLGLICALFHDAGLIQTEDDLEGTGAKYTVGHEDRSIEFLSRYLWEKGFSKDDFEDCSHIISCTNLNNRISDIPFRNEESKLLGQCLGSADLLAQMSDRLYLEKLLLLFQEFHEAKINQFSSELDLLEQTQSFYENLARIRLTEDFGNVVKNLEDHFTKRWGITSDLYFDAIQRNLDYLRKILNEPGEDYREKLRRGGIVNTLDKE